MNTSILIYLYIVFGNVVTSLMLALVVGGIILVMYSFVSYMENGKNIFKPYFKQIGWFCGLSILMACLYPSKDDLKFILGGYVVSSITEVEGVKELPENIVKAANVFLEGLGEESKEDVKK